MRAIGVATTLTVLLTVSACTGDRPAATPEPSPPGVTADRSFTGSPSAAVLPPPIPRELRRLAGQVISYALGRTESFPTAESVWFGLDGTPIKAVDEMPDALSDRDIWQLCPRGAEGYAGFSCPLDLLEPIRSAQRQGSRLVITRDAEVLCARADIEPPGGRFVVVRPRGETVSCVNDFALVLGADADGRLTSATMTVAEP